MSAVAQRAAPSRLGAVLSRLNVVSGFAVLILLWEGAPRLGLVNATYFPPLSELLVELARLASTPLFWEYVLNTSRTWAIGLLAAVAAGVLIGLVIGLVPGLRKYTHSTVEFLRPIPSVALIPAVILIFGTKFESGVVLIIYAAFWQVLLQVLYGLTDIDAVARDTARSFRFTRRGYVIEVVWPTILPYLFTGIRLAAATALVLAITGEMVIGTIGIGRGIAFAQTAGDVSTMYALVIVAGIMGVLVNVLARLLEKRVLWWHPSVRNAKAD